MATLQIKDVAHRFPVGSTVTLHPRAAQQENGPPAAPALASGTVQANGTVTFADVADEAAFTAYSLVDGEHVYHGCASLAISTQNRVWGDIVTPYDV